MQTLSAMRVAARLLNVQLRCFAVSAYSAYVKEAMKSAEVKKLPSKERIAAVGKLWKGLPATVRKQWEDYASKLNSKAAAPASVPKKAAQKKPAAAKKASSAKPKPKPKAKAKSAVEKKAPVKATQAPKPAKKISAYHVFVKAMNSQPEILALPIHQRVSAAAKKWKVLSAQEKKPYVDQAQATNPATQKKAPSAYQLFVTQTYARDEIKALPMEKRLKRIAELWKALPEKEKAPFVEEAARLKPSSIKKAPSPYAIFVKEAYKRAEVQALPFHNRLGKIAEIWKGLSEKERESYKKPADAASEPTTTSKA
eukprot:RCo013295